MKALFSVFILFSLTATITNGQKYFTKSGTINFDVTAAESPENIIAINRSAICVLDTKTGTLQFSVLMKGFEFERALMQEHFNENYIESSKFPKGDFKGVIVNNSEVNYSKDASYKVIVEGKMTIHGMVNDVKATGKITMQDGKLLALSEFAVKVADYNISIPKLVSDKVATIVKINVTCTLELLKTN